METIKKLRGTSNDAKDKKLLELLETLDHDSDGRIDDLDDVLKVKLKFEYKYRIKMVLYNFVQFINSSLN
jgi:hypothetical protein